MKRDEAERLFSHHYRLYSQVRAVVDTSPPYSMFNSPKSSHYRTSNAARRSQSVESLNRRQYQGGRVELAQFIQRPSTSTGSRTVHSFNRYSSGSMCNLSVFNPPKPPPLDLSKIGSKLRYSRNYQPPKKKLHPKLPRPNSKSSSSQSYSTSTSEKSPKRQQETMKHCERHREERSPQRMSSAEEEYDEYEEFKNSVLDDILVRGVYSDRVIKDAFAHEMEKRRGHLNMKKMKKVMLECFDDLGVELDSETEFRRRAILAHSDLYPYESTNYMEPEINYEEREFAKPRTSIRDQIMRGGSTGTSSSSVSISSSQRSDESHFSYESQKSDDRRSHGATSISSDSDFALDAKPPSTLSSSSSGLIDFPHDKEGADHFDLPDRELSLSSQDDEFPDRSDARSDLGEMIERAMSLESN